ncbi:MAG: type II toxin-antitoxin system PemK/MazF family toxin [Lachnospiraceae bacterium]|jgi:mRNA-degrading endonuclease toxin of MazEF toxin-antitoxin module|nr:type II toxin-antitoxin system PemK/MazF family toxin [Lachnospiraceae bacterium]
MKDIVNQGDILIIGGIKEKILVVSKDFFNQSKEVIGCPIFEKESKSPLHIFFEGLKTKGYVHCEKLKLFDLQARSYTIADRIHMADIINITDAIQGIFDYM